MWYFGLIIRINVIELILFSHKCHQRVKRTKRCDAFINWWLMKLYSKYGFLLSIFNTTGQYLFGMLLKKYSSINVRFLWIPSVIIKPQIIIMDRNKRRSVSAYHNNFTIILSLSDGHLLLQVSVNLIFFEVQLKYLFPQV